MNTERENKINVMLECIEALRRGVQEPTVIRNENGTFDYIPGAYLTDASYTGSRDVVFTVGYDGWGDFDPDTATENEIYEAAEWAADDWDWTTD